MKTVNEVLDMHRLNNLDEQTKSAVNAAIKYYARNVIDSMVELGDGYYENGDLIYSGNSEYAAIWNVEAIEKFKSSLK